MRGICAVDLQSVSGFGEVATVQIQTEGTGGWNSAKSRWGAVWEIDSLPGAGPYGLHVTLADGTEVRKEV